MFRDVIERRRYLFAVIARLAASGVAVWMLPHVLTADYTILT
jgi:hypothetical protein